MQPFLVMIGQLFLIACIQSVLEIYVQDGRHIGMNRLLTIACYLGSLYVVLQFTFQYVFQELIRFFGHLF